MYKLNAATIGAWADILTRCPQSRLVLGNAALDDPANREHLRRRFSHFGIAAERLSMLGPAPHFEFLRYYDLIDVALDPFPYSGGTTTTEAIWQGVPVLTAGGDRWIARTSASILANAGLGRFVHESVAAYVDAAVSIGSSAATPRRLSALRRTLRERVRQSPVCDCARFSRCMEHEYRRLSFPRITSPRTETMP
jgi:predicted O-linked N-acetylglucosamine transferase (SPINDLY family)